MAAASLVVKVEAQVAQFQKSFADATRTAQKFEKDFANTASSVSAQQKRITDAFSSFSGDKLAREAVSVAKAVEQIGGASKLTAAEQAKVNSLMTDAIAKYTALGQVAPKAVTDLANATKLVEQQTSLASKAAGFLQSSFAQFTAAGLASQAISGMTTAVAGFISQGSKLQSVETSFNRLSGAAKQSGADILTAMRGGTRGMVADIDLMLSANKALLLGLPVTAQTMGELSEAATKLGRAMGQDATKSVDDLITALGRSSPLILDNLGLSVKVGEANEAYAQKLGKTADALTDAERKTAFYQAAMEAAREATKTLGDQSKTLGEIFDTVWTSAGNVITRFSSDVNVGLGAAFSSMRNFAMFSEDVLKYGVAVAVANAALREQIIQSKAAENVRRAETLTIRDYVKELQLQKDSMVGLTAEGKKQYAAALQLDAKTEELTKQFGLSEIQQKLMADALKVGTKATKEAQKAQDEYRKLLAGDVKKAQEEARIAWVKYTEIIIKANLGITEGISGISERSKVELKWLNQITEELTLYRDAINSVNRMQRIGLDSAPGIAFTPAQLFDESLLKKSAKKAGDTFGRELSQAIIGAVQGGGDIGKALGAVIGQQVGEQIGKTLAKAIGNKFGEALGGMLGPLGAIGGQLIGGLFDKLFGKSGRRKDVEAFADSFGGFDKLQKRLETLPRGADVFWKALTQGGGKAKTAIDAITEAFRLQDEAMSQTAPKYADVTAAASRYGLEVTKIGDAINSLRVTETAQQAIDDWELMAKAGADLELVAAGMADEMQVLVLESLKWGHALPEAMRPILQKMTDMGLLTDDAGDKLVDLDRLKFEKPLIAAIDGLITKLDELIEKISGGVGGALRGLPSGIDVDVPQLGRGGIVRRPTLALIGESGPEAVVPLGGGNSRGMGGGPIVVQTYLDGYQIAEATVPHIPSVLGRRG